MPKPPTTITNNLAYLTLKSAAQQEIPAIKGSRFIGFAYPIISDEAALSQLSEIKRAYPDARHHCWAYQLRQQQKTRFSDDGEPSGSAGKPILAPIVGRQLFDTLVIVVRYFGGVKLGIGGLVRAYSQCANSVLDVATIINVVPKTTLMINYPYSDSQAIASALANLALVPQNECYTDSVYCELSVEPAAVSHVVETLQNYTRGRVIVKS